MNIDRTRRGFLADVGRGALVATLGGASAADLGLAVARGEGEGDVVAGTRDRLTFGDREPLVALMQETQVERLLPALVAKLTFAFLAGGGAVEAFNDLLPSVQDNTEVHRTVLPYRSWDLLGLIGMDHARTLLRQSVRYCVKSEREWTHNE